MTGMSALARDVSMFAPLRLRDYRLVFTGMVLSQALMPLQFVTQIFWVQNHVDADVRIILVGLIGTMRGAGQLGFGLFGGALADRFDRRRLLLASQSIALLLTLSITAIFLTGSSGVDALAAFYLLSLLASGMFAVNAPTRQAMIAEIVGPDLVGQGVALGSAGMQLALPLAIFASGFLVDSLGFAGAYGLSAFGHAGEIVTLLLLGYRGTVRASEASAGLARDGLRDVREGIRYARGHDAVLWVILLMVAMVGLGQPAVANLGPTWVTTVVGVPFKYFGVIAITWAIGAFIVSACLARWFDSSRSGALVVAGALGYSLAFILFASGHSVPFAVAGNLGLGACMSLAQISSSTLLLRVVPNEVRGRVMSLLMLNMGISQLITAPLAAIGQAITLQVLFPALALVCLATVGLISATHPVIWRRVEGPGAALEGVAGE